MQTINDLWNMYEVWANARIQSPYTKRAALRLKAKALIAEDRHSR